jgi:hypothetical protein
VRFLFLAYYYPPIKSIGVRRNWLLAEHLRPLCERLFVITTSNRRHLLQDSYNLDESNISVASTFDYRTLTALLQPKQTVIHFTENQKSNPLVHFGIRLLDSFPFNLLFHEGGLIYTMACFFKAIRLIRREKITHIYSSFRPMSDHFTAHLLKIFFPKLIWIADFRDLHVDPLYQMPIGRRFQLWCNRRLIRRADWATTVSEGLAVHLRLLHPRVFVWRNGIDVRINYNANTSAPTKFTIAYTGSMFQDERNPKLLMEVLRRVFDEKIINPDNCQILYAGKDTGIWLDWVRRYGLEDFFVSEGLVSAERACEIQQTAHINLLLTSALPNYGGVLTGKFFEYLGATQPIVVLINGAQDIEFEQIMNELNAGLVAYNDRSYAELRAFILSNFEHWQQQGFVQKTIHLDRLRALNWAAAAEKFVEKIKTI